MRLRYDLRLGYRLLGAAFKNTTGHSPGKHPSNALHPQKKAEQFLDLKIVNQGNNTKERRGGREFNWGMEEYNSTMIIPPKQSRNWDNKGGTKMQWHMLPDCVY